MNRTKELYGTARSLYNSCGGYFCQLSNVLVLIMTGISQLTVFIYVYFK